MQLYYGDNLQVLRDSIATESVDLIYLDPPSTARPPTTFFLKARWESKSSNRSFGLRQSEQFKTRWEWADLDRGIFTVPRSKSGRTRRLPLGEGCAIDSPEFEVLD